MDKKDEAFLKKLLATFKIEAGEHVARISSGLLALEKTPNERQTEIIETVFREAHSMKGAARSVNLVHIESLCGSLETLFASLKSKEISLTRDMLDVLHTAVDSLLKLVESAEPGKASSREPVTRRLIAKIEEAAKAGKHLPEGSNDEDEEEDIIAPEPEVHGDAAEGRGSPVGKAPSETTRIAKTKLDAILLQAEGLLSVKMSASQRCTEMREIIADVAASKKKWTRLWGDIRAVRKSLERDDGPKGRKNNPKLTNLIEFIGSNEDSAKSLHGKLASLEKSLEQDRRSMGTMIDGLLDEAKKAAMSPFSSLLEIFPKIVRDISYEQGKEAEVVVRGGDIEIDRRILEEMKDPFIHLVRNCIDHGIEKPGERTSKNKPRSGMITISVSHRSGKKVEVMISDDGSGIDIDSIRASAVKAGVLSAAEADKLGDEEITPFIFRSGVTSSPIITDISGRGLGLAIVLEKVEQLGGTVYCESGRGAGATFRIMLPLSLATFRGVLVQAGGRFFVLPTTYLECVTRVNRNEIKTVENRDTILLRGRTIPLVPLNSILGLPGKEERGREKEFVQAAVLVSSEERIAVSVGEIISEQEVLVKGLGRQLSRVRTIAGSTVLGTGEVVPVLNVPQLMKSAVRVSAPVRSPAAVREEAAGGKAILVVEDSITARTLLKNILDAAGYDVHTAVDGMDAFTVLKTGEFDLVVSDVDMPRLNGFELTSKIRADKKFAELPVVLVTALETREDREHGIDVGANAYIVKSSFDQSNLLEVIKRLI